ncbi:HupE/UreJ family protein [Corallococcus carmarthensis]|uniref:HupE/UreJ family protein n=1 Tax=Corallococcus carmarthensis TaxID=2316728 RepID=A0A3A8K4G8_9BACT|nr:HupE/UreJ family protein [Corallococcus carmarthensis]NOK19950.1 HupE/UreJ family protein [Corallococcus carmarthensis]RKG97331.1 HupE/UreJ family protein [Corallococcus carmarthensis]
MKALSLVAVLLPLVALAHKPSDSYLHLDRAGDGFSGRWDVALRDLEEVLVLDADGDGAITWSELRARQPDVAGYALARLKLSAEGAPCPLAPASALRVVRHSDGAYAVVDFTAACPAAPRALDLDYTLLFDRDPQHRGIVRVGSDGAGEPLVLSATRHTAQVSLEGLSPWRRFGQMVHSGIEHIWAGVDHLLFLLALLLPSVLRRDRATGRWVPVGDFGSAMKDVVKVVSAFTLAHSLTLSAASLGWVALPSRLVESAIAASVIVAALNNVFPLMDRTRWLAAFALGLLHGFGFASVLADLELPAGSLAVTLFGFNVGVELGQLACVAVFLPVAFLLRDTRVYRRALLVGGSAVIALVACAWLWERAFGVALSFA